MSIYCNTDFRALFGYTLAQVHRVGGNRSFCRSTDSSCNRTVPPFFAVFLVALLIITYFPQLYLWLPRASLGN